MHACPVLSLYTYIYAKELIIENIFFSATFEIVPSSLTVAVEQETATFYCQHSNSDGINWRVDGLSLNVLNSPNIHSSSSNPQINGAKLYSLSIKTVSEFNQSNVVCVAVFFDESPSQYTPPVTLLIQGLSVSHCVLLCIIIYDTSNLHCKQERVLYYTSTSVLSQLHLTLLQFNN